jgi:hypothetical protein
MLSEGRVGAMTFVDGLAALWWRTVLRETG